LLKGSIGGRDPGLENFIAWVLGRLVFFTPALRCNAKGGLRTNGRRRGTTWQSLGPIVPFSAFDVSGSGAVCMREQEKVGRAKSFSPNTVSI